MFVLLALAIVVACLIVLTLAVHVLRQERKPNPSSKMQERVVRSLAEVYDLPVRDLRPIPTRMMAVPRKRPLIETRSTRTL